MRETVIGAARRDQPSAAAAAGGPETGCAPPEPPPAAGRPAAWRRAVYGADGCLAAVLASGEGMVVHVNGTCMEPVIGDRARARIEPVRRLSPGDVIAVRSAPEGTGVLMHRFLGPVWTPGGWRLMTMADAANRPDPLAEDAQVLGKVVALNTCTYRVTLPVRALALARYAYWTLRLAIRRLVRG